MGMLHFWQQNSEKYPSYIICIDFLEFVTTKLKLNLTYVRLFIRFVSTKNKNLYSLYNVLKHLKKIFLKQIKKDKKQIF